ncbi:hypothetical protein PISMIDRAFT_117675 [Pisolithus microcarpus 441]|uniref:DUF8040 domain-containing protein n=1 Tax=Pisolithus microcarpus 441 TaxID=765257 RepID=A0A0C9YJV7_9AGAM|nr:hypothetical protein PISMIDRAFT_117675 [Pisolithus microcarpus 441]
MLQEQLGIFLYIVVTGLIIRHVGERFQQSNGTISKYFKRMLSAFTLPRVYAKYVQLPHSDTPTHPYILNNPKFFPFFVDAIGTIDGTHVTCAPVSRTKGVWRREHGPKKLNDEEWRSLALMRRMTGVSSSHPSHKNHP